MVETQRLHILVLNQISANGLKRLPAETLRGGQGHRRARRGAAALGRHARHGHPGQRQGHRPRRRRHQQHPGAGDERARRAGVQRAGRQCQCGQGTGAGRHAAGRAQPAGGAALRGRARPEDGRHGQGRRRRQEGLRRLRAVGPDAGHRRPGQDRLPGGRRRHQAGHAGAGLRPGDHGRRGLEPAGAGQARGQRGRGAAQQRLRHPARAAGGGHAPPGQRRQHRLDARRRGAAELLARRRGRRGRRAGRAGRPAPGPLRLRLPQPGPPRPRARDRAAAPGRVDARGRGELRHHGRRPAARLPGKRQRGQRRQLPAGEHGARVGLPRGHRQCQRAQHAGADLHRDGAGRAEHPQHGQQVARRDGLHAGRRGQRRRRAVLDSLRAIGGVLSVRYLPRQA